MSDYEFRFEVTVRVCDWPDEDKIPLYAGEDHKRTARDFAESSLNACGLTEARYTDGFADFADFDPPGNQADAHIGDVTFIEEIPQ